MFVLHFVQRQLMSFILSVGHASLRYAINDLPFDIPYFSQTATPILFIVNTSKSFVEKLRTYPPRLYSFRKAPISNCDNSGISQHLPDCTRAVSSENLVEVCGDAVAGVAAVAHDEIVRLLLRYLLDRLVGDIFIKAGNQIPIGN